jgi:hypothetical protein
LRRLAKNLRQGPRVLAELGHTDAGDVDRLHRLILSLERGHSKKPKDQGHEERSQLATKGLARRIGNQGREEILTQRAQRSTIVGRL